MERVGIGIRWVNTLVIVFASIINTVDDALLLSQLGVFVSVAQSLECLSQLMRRVPPIEGLEFLEDVLLHYDGCVQSCRVITRCCLWPATCFVFLLPRHCTSRVTHWVVDGRCRCKSKCRRVRVRVQVQVGGWGGGVIPPEEFWCISCRGMLVQFLQGKFHDSPEGIAPTNPTPECHPALGSALGRERCAWRLSTPPPPQQSLYSIVYSVRTIQASVLNLSSGKVYQLTGMGCA